MNKTKLGIVSCLLGLGLTLSACGNEETSKPAEEQKTKVETKTPEPEKNLTSDKAGENIVRAITFEDGILETEKFRLKITKTELIKSPMEQKPGLFVTFALTNKTKDEDIVPADVIMNLLAQQENGTSRIDLAENYYFLDAFGSEEDVETYNKMVDLSNASSNALLPSKTTSFVEAYSLDNDTHNVTFTGIDQNTFEQVGKYIVNLK